MFLMDDILRSGERVFRLADECLGPMADGDVLYRKLLEGENGSRRLRCRFFTRADLIPTGLMPPMATCSINGEHDVLLLRMSFGPLCLAPMPCDLVWDPTSGSYITLEQLRRKLREEESARILTKLRGTKRRGW